MEKDLDREVNHEYRRSIKIVVHECHIRLSAELPCMAVMKIEVS